MFGKKAKAIKALLDERDNLVAEISSMEKTMDGMRAHAEQQNAAITDKDQKLSNAQALIQRAEADRDMQKRRADENYALYDKEKARADSLVVPFTAAVQTEAGNVQGLSDDKAPDTQREVPRPKKPKRG